jgi:L-xylulokinase
VPGDRRYLCLDCGLTATKAAVFDGAGRELAAASARTPVRVSGEASEIDMEEQWRLAARLVGEALARAREAGGVGEIDGVGVSGHGGGVYPVDAGGRPVRAAFTSMDARASSLVEGWAREGRSRHAVTRHHPWAGQALPQLRWLRDAAPDEYGRVRWALAAKDWMVLRLTGEVSTDRTDASNGAVMDLAAGRYDPEVCALFGAPEVPGKLPPVHESAAVVGRVSAAAAAATGLREGTPVVAGMFDVVACAVGSGALDARSCSLIAGTWNINSAFDGRLLDVSPSVKTSLGPDAGRYAYVESSATSAGNLEWFLSALEALAGAPAGGREALYRRIDAGVEALPPGAEGVAFLPFIHRAHLAPGVDAAFVGLRAEHGPFHMIRAILEGVAYAHRAHLEILASGGLSRERAVLSGGAASSPAWCRIFADVLDRPVETSDASQAGARGIAVAAAVGTGQHRSYAEAMAAMVRPGRRFTPDPDRAAKHRDCYARFRDVAARLGGIPRS